MVAGGARAGGAGRRRARARVAAAAQRGHRDHGVERQDDDDGADRATSTAWRALPVAVAGNVGTALTLAAPARSIAGGDRRLRGLVVPARGHAGVRARGRGAAQPHAGPSRPPRHLRGLPRRQAADLRPPGTDGGRGLPSASRPTARHGACASRLARRCFRRGRRRVGRRRHALPDGALWWRGSRDAGARAAAPRRAQPRERDGRRRGDARPRRGPRARSAPGWAPSRASRTGWRRSRDVGGVLYVDDSKATNVASAVVGIRSFEGGVHAILGGRGKEEDYGALAAPVAERCRAVYLIGEEAAPLAARWPTAASRCTTAATSITPSPPPARRGGRRGRPALARLRVLRPVPLLRGAGRPLPRPAASCARLAARGGADAGRRRSRSAGTPPRRRPDRPPARHGGIPTAAPGQIRLLR